VRLFESSALYRHNYGQLFDDWLTILVCMFANGRMEEEYLKVIERYKPREVAALADMTGKYMELMCQMVPAKGHWYDALGEIYMYLNSKSKSSRLGQFFTPASLCDLIARMTPVDPGKTVLEPACGSGRMVLAIHALHPSKDLRIAIDVDPMCAKMTAINFLLHGVRAEVACANTLEPDRWDFAYQTHPQPWVPFIVAVPRERSLTAPRMEQIKEQAINAVLPKEKTAAPTYVQTNLFDQ
jgi:type I restriction enzyme M protein